MADANNATATAQPAQKKQKILKTEYTPLEALQELKRIPRQWDAKYEAVISAATGWCVLKCKACGKELSVANPSGSTGPHSLACKGNAGAADSSLEETEDMPGNSGTAAGSSTAMRGSIARYAASAEQQAKAIKNIMLFIITSELPLLKVKNPYLREAFAAVGVSLPSMETFRTSILDKLHAQVVQKVEKRMSALLLGPGIMLCADGWKKRAALQSSPLMNFIALHPDGGVTYLLCRDTSGESKTAEYLTTIIKEEAKKVGKQQACCMHKRMKRGRQKADLSCDPCCL